MQREELERQLASLEKALEAERSMACPDVRRQGYIIKALDRLQVELSKLD